MAVTISAKGQVALPKEVRTRLHIKAGDQFRVEDLGNKDSADAGCHRTQRAGLVLDG